VIASQPYKVRGYPALDTSRSFGENLIMTAIKKPLRGRDRVELRAAHGGRDRVILEINFEVDIALLRDVIGPRDRISMVMHLEADMI